MGQAAIIRKGRRILCKMEGKVTVKMSEKCVIIIYA